ncbi:dehydrogenase [Spirochaetia bacterium]|nr:dehydrogenase [Spirochaetia bacterium]
MLIRSKAPLRLGLAGGGTDISSYYNLHGGYILNATIDMYAYCTIEPTDDNSITFIAADIEKQEAYPSSPCIEIHRDLKLHTGVYNSIVKKFNNNRALSFRMTTYSDAPAGSGLGSSSTMVVAIIKAYVEWLNLPLGEYDIAALSYEIERSDLQLAGGKQDQYAATFGGFNFMEFYQDEKVIVNPLRLKRWIRNELENSLVLYYTGVSRESSNIIRQQIENTKNNNVKSIESMHEIKKQAIKMKESLLMGDFKSFSQCLTDGWNAKKNAAEGISNPFINELMDYILANGAEAGKISGAGGGGFIMCFCDPCKRMTLIRALKKRDGVVMTPSFTELGTQAWTIYNN